MNFLAIATLNSVRSCLRLPISMMPRFSLKLMLARLRTGIDSAGSRLRSAAVITVSATLTSFFSTGAGFFALALAMVSLPLLPFRRFALSLALRCLGLPRPGLGRLHLHGAGPVPRRAVLAAAQHGRSSRGSLGSDADRGRQAPR